MGSQVWMKQQPAKTYIHKLYVDTGCHLEDLIIGMDDKRESKDSLL